MNDLPDEASISFFVACYNERENIYATLQTLTAALSDFKFSFEIVVIDDASSDGSPDEIQRFQMDNPSIPIRLIVRKANIGLAVNYVDCAFATRGAWYRLICGDNVESVETLRAAFAAIGSADMVITYPVRRVGFSAYRNLISKTYTQIVNAITGHKIKYYNSPTIHRRADVLRWHSRSRGFSFQADLIAQLLDRGSTYVEIPVVAVERVNGQSTALSLRNFLSVGHSLIEMVARRVRRWLFENEGKTRNPGPSRLAWGKLAISAILLIALATFSNASATFHTMRQVSPGFFIIAVLAITLHVFLGTLRWWLILRLGGAEVGLARLCSINFIASFLGQALPAGIGTDGVRVMLLRKQGVRTTCALVAVVLDRTFLLAVLLVVCGVTFLTLASPASMGASQEIIDGIGIAFFVISPLPIVGLLAIGWLGNSGLMSARVGNASELVSKPIRRILSRPIQVFMLSALSIASFSNLAFCAWLLARGLNLPINFETMWLVMAPALLAASLPISLGGWGVRELTLVSGLAHVGIPATAALSLSLLFGLCGILGTLPAVPLWMTHRNAKSVATH